MFLLRLFGSADLITEDQCSVHSVLAQPKRLALLAYLAAARPGSLHRRDRLLALFWPDSSMESARRALNQAVYYLRRSLGETVLLSRGDDLGVDPAEIACDVAAFDRAMDEGAYQEAIVLYTGELLEGFHLSDAPEFERWMDEERGRLRRAAAKAAWHLSEAAEQKGERAAVLKWALRAHSHAPDEESGLRRLLSTLVQSGERAEAVRAYETFATRLKADLDLSPSAETQALVAEICSPGAVQAAPDAPAPSSSAESSPGVALRSATASSRKGPASPAALHDPPAITSGIRRRWLLLAGALVLFVVGIASWPRNMDGVHAAVGDVDPSTRVLVAPFENRTGDPANDVLGDMAADWIMQGLQGTDLVQVVDPVSALLAVRDVEGSPHEGHERAGVFARNMAVGIVVSGAVYQQGDSLRFHGQVTDAHAGRLLRTFEPVSSPRTNPIAGVEALRAQVAGALASMFDRRIAALATASGRPPTLEAYREYMQGLEQFQMHDYRQAVLHFEAAARRDSAFALPLIWAAFAHGNVGQREKRDSVVRILAARRDRLDPLDRHALDYFQASSRKDAPAQLQAAREAARLAPGSNWSFMVGYILNGKNQPREALQWLDRVDRGWVRGWANYSMARTDALHALREHERELAEARRGLGQSPDDFRLKFYELRALIALGEIEEVRDRLEEALRLPLGGTTGAQEQGLEGVIVNAVAEELRAHGHLAEAQRIAERGVAWHHARARMAAAPNLRAGFHHSYGWALYAAGQWQASQEQWKQLASQRPPDSILLSAMGAIAVRLGDDAEADRIEGQLHQKDTTLGLAQMAALRGDKQRAVALLHRYMQEKAFGTPPWLMAHAERNFDSLRGYPPFEALVRISSAERAEIRQHGRVIR